MSKEWGFRDTTLSNEKLSTETLHGSLGELH